MPIQNTLTQGQHGFNPTLRNRNDPQVMWLRVEGRRLRRLLERPRTAV